MKNLTLLLKKFFKMKPKISKRKKIAKIRAEINEIETIKNQKDH